MSAQVKFKDPATAIKIYQGMLTLSALYTSYHEVLRRQYATPIQYLLMDGSEMIYQMELFMRSEIVALNHAVVTHPTLTHIIFVTPSDHPLRSRAEDAYQRLGMAHKVHYVINQADGLLLIEKSAATPTAIR